MKDKTFSLRSILNKFPETYVGRQVKRVFKGCLFLAQ